MKLEQFLTVLLVVLTLIGVAVGRYPWLRMNRATIALVGADAGYRHRFADIGAGVCGVGFEYIGASAGDDGPECQSAVGGVFSADQYAGVRLARYARQLLALLILAAGLLSALFLNDTIVLMLTPLVLEVTRALKRNPIPYLMGLTAAANIGSTATITGNPQNMLIGISSGIPYLTFTAFLAPIALVGMGLAWVVLIIVYRQEFAPSILPQPPELKVELYRPLLNKSLVATGGMLAAFLAGVPIPLAAMSAAALLLITRRLKPERVFEEIDWGLLVFFAGLFVVTGALETSGVSERLFAVLRPLAERGVAPLTGVSVVRNLVSNVPAVMLFRPLIPGFSAPQTAWLTLAMATTLAGNLTLLGSVANLIVAETAKRQGVNLTFSEYLKAGVPITLLTQRSHWLAQVAPHTIGAQEMRRVSGLDYWFAPAGSTTKAPPPRWKVAVVTWLGIFPTVLLLFLTVAPLLADWPLVPRTMVITVLVVVLMTWVVAPRLTRWLAGWLHARP